MVTKLSRFKKVLALSFLALTLAFSLFLGFQGNNIASAKGVNTAVSTQHTLKVVKHASKVRHLRANNLASGTVSISSATSLTITNKKGKTLTFTVDANTKFVNVTNPVAKDTKVHVKYVLKNGNMVALRVAGSKKK